MKGVTMTLSYFANKLTSGRLRYVVNFSAKTICIYNLTGSPRGARGANLGVLYKKAIKLNDVCNMMSEFCKSGTNNNNKGFLCAVLRDFIKQKSFHDELDLATKRTILEALIVYYS